MPRQTSRIQPRITAVAAAIVALIVVATSVVAGPPSADAQQSGVDGQPSIGDPMIPTAGNSGYDVNTYSINLTFDEVTREIDAFTEIELVASEPLASFSLDLSAELTVSSVSIGGEAATFATTANKLTVTAPSTITAGSTATVRVDYGGKPLPVSYPDTGDGGWVDDGTLVHVFGEPPSASSWFPVNDHPLDKAVYTITVTADSNLEVAANGLLDSKTTNGDDTTWVYVSQHPQASYLTMVLIGQLTFDDDGDLTLEDGRTVRIRHVYEDSTAEEISAATGRAAQMVHFYADLFGPYPFEAWGIASVPRTKYAALETQTLSIHGLAAARHERVHAHELVHQWFGNHVSVGEWEDIWLNEGITTYFEWMWNLGASLDSPFADEVNSYHFLWSGEDSVKPGAPADASELFDGSVYERGALAVHALRLEIGERHFWDLIRQWSQRHGEGNARTEDFVGLAEELAGRQLDDLFNDWLMTSVVPNEMPHRTTKVDVVEVLEWEVGLLGDTVPVNGDANDDGTVNLFDALELVQKLEVAA